MTKIHDQELTDWQDKFKAREIHLVCVAAGGLTTCDFAASTLGGMDQKDVWPLTLKVNQAGETGTFHPRLPLTVLPLLKWENRPEPSDDEEFLRQSFRDVVTANREHVKLKTLYIDLNGWGFDYDYELARRIAEEVLTNATDVETIYFAPKKAM